MIRRLIIAGILLAIGIPARADVPDMRGRWQGFQRSVALGDINGDGRLDITAQRGHRFDGQVYVAGASGGVWKTTNAVVNQNGVVNLMGMDDGGNTLQGHGRVVVLVNGGALLALRFQILDPVGVVIDQGILLALQMYGGLQWDQQDPDFAMVADGDWLGHLMSEVSGDTFGAGLMLSHLTDTTMIHGSARIFETEMLVVGTIAPPSADKQTFDTEMLAVRPSGWVGLQIGQLVHAVPDRPDMLVGKYIEWENFLGVFAELVHGKNTSIDHGSYNYRRRRR